MEYKLTVEGSNEGECKLKVGSSNGVGVHNVDRGIKWGEAQIESKGIKWG